MSKINLADVANLQNETTATGTINSNSALIETAIENTLSRDGTSPNQMGATLDMNSHRIINLPVGVGDTEPVRVKEFNTLALDNAAEITIIEQPDNFYRPRTFYTGDWDAAFTTMLAAIKNDGLPAKVIIDESIPLTSQKLIDFNDLQMECVGGGEIVLPGGSANLFSGLISVDSPVVTNSSVITLTADSIRHISNSLVFSSVVGMNTGDLLTFTWTNDLGPGASSSFCARIDGIGGNTVVLSHPLPWSLFFAANPIQSSTGAVQTRKALTGIVFTNMKFRRTSGYTGPVCTALKIGGCYKPFVNGLTTSSTPDGSSGFTSGALQVQDCVGGTFTGIKSDTDGKVADADAGDPSLTGFHATYCLWSDVYIRNAQYFAYNFFSCHYSTFRDIVMNSNENIGIFLKFARCGKFWDCDSITVDGTECTNWVGSELISLQNQTRNSIFNNVKTIGMRTGTVLGVPFPAFAVRPDNGNSSDNIFNNVLAVDTSTTGNGRDIAVGLGCFNNIFCNTVADTIDVTEWDPSTMYNTSVSNNFSLTIDGSGNLNLSRNNSNAIRVNGRVVAPPMTIVKGPSGIGAGINSVYLGTSRVDVITRARSANIVTLTTNSFHKLSPGSVIQVGGCGSAGFSGPQYDGTFVVLTTPDGFTLTYAATGANESTKFIGGSLTGYYLTLSLTTPVADQTGTFVKGDDFTLTYVGSTNVNGVPAFTSVSTYPSIGGGTASLDATLNTITWTPRSAGAGGTGDVFVNIGRDTTTDFATVSYNTNGIRKSRAGLINDSTDNYEIQTSTDGAAFTTRYAVDPSTGKSIFTGSLGINQSPVHAFDVTGAMGCTGVANFTDTSASTTTNSGAVVVTGGLGVQKQTTTKNIVVEQTTTGDASDAMVLHHGDESAGTPLNNGNCYFRMGTTGASRFGIGAYDDGGATNVSKRVFIDTALGWNLVFGKPDAGGEVLMLSSDSAGHFGVARTSAEDRAIRPNFSLSLGGAVARTIGMERRGASGAGAGLTVNSGGAFATGTDLSGGNLTLAPGTATGNGGSSVLIQAVATGQGAGTTDRNPSTVATYSGTGLAVTGAISATSSVKSSSATAGIGYATGAGATVTQATNRTTGVAISSPTGAITTNNTSLAIGISATFTVTNSSVAITDVILLSIRSGQTNKETRVTVSAVAAGSFDITVMNQSTTTAETGAIIINYAVIKGVTS